MAARARSIRKPLVRPAAAATLPQVGNRRLSTEKIIFIGASTGGTEAVREVLERTAGRLAGRAHHPAHAAGLHPELRRAPRRPVQLARQRGGRRRARAARARLHRPGRLHLRLTRSGANYVARVDDGEPVNRHKPSVEVLFRSAAELCGPNAIGVMLTGMGKDGALAMRRMKDAGAWNVAQDEASCVVFGMPKEAIAAGAVDEILPVQDIAGRLLQRLGSAALRTNRV